MSEPIVGTEIEIASAPIPPPRELSLLPSRSELEVFIDLANNLAVGFAVSKSVALAKMLYGREVGIGPMVALQEIHMIENKCSLSAASMIALIRRRKLGEAIVLETSPLIARVKFSRPGMDDQIIELALEQAHARRLHLSSAGKIKSNWQNHPASMLLARVFSFGCKAMFQDIFLGLSITPDELGADTDENGTPIDFSSLGSSSSADPIQVKKSVESTAVTVEQAEEVATNVQASIRTPPDPPPIVSYPIQPTEESSRRESLGLRLKMLAERLELSQEHLKRIASKFKSGGPQSKATTNELAEIVSFVSLIGEIRFCVSQLSIVPSQWISVLAKRGVREDINLTPQQAEELHEKLVKQVTPFLIDKFRAETAFKGGNNAASIQGTLGNGQ